MFADRAAKFNYNLQRAISHTDDVQLFSVIFEELTLFKIISI